MAHAAHPHTTAAHVRWADSWKAAGLVPLLLKAAPEHPLALSFARKTNKHAAVQIQGEDMEVEVGQLHKSPTIDFPLDSSSPEALWTIACVDLDWPNPELLNHPKESHHHKEMPAYRHTSVAGASTPPQQRIAWLILNAPSPSLAHQGLEIATWDAAPEKLEEKQEVHRFVLLVFKQRNAVEPRHTRDIHIDGSSAHSHRILGLSKLLHGHKEIFSDHAWAGAFFIVDCQSDEMYATTKRVNEMMKPVENSVHLPHATKHPHPHPHPKPEDDEREEEQKEERVIKPIEAYQEKPEEHELESEQELAKKHELPAQTSSKQTA